ncbi:phosrestin-2 [Fopius arisanus]|uniref:ARRH_0 protein n=1 Tax=Fopius arisanus TaxID=64838 RepID=A0A0C9RKZ9_9HYME|nr:PREDICTED: phosrestin-2-like [Fopius arisanus]XP_011302379.1 PREDICTED: phosrestin-2-like [Fopius arisanus]XP_011302380.1 PREDICTED: phosrestin-2-like [Fopius arisanus]XP_011302381.1 PREDICTED: phosrestin-2-like [Fopius arisanus]XP_011302382.1 PREDICTED: phosrestin-2-like [Fopius arisanus]
MGTNDKGDADVICVKEDSTREDRELTCREQMGQSQPTLHTDRVFKRYLPNNKLRLYIINRDLVVSQGKIDKLLGVIVVEPDYVRDKRVYAQITLTARLSREEEEVMGVKFCNEIPFCFTQLYPPYSHDDQPPAMTPVQEALIRSRGPNAYPFSVEVPAVAPPSIRLRPPQKYNGAPLGTSYEFRAWVAERADQRSDESSTVRMGITVIQRGLPTPRPISKLCEKPGCMTESTATSPVSEEPPAPPTAVVKRRLLLTEGSIRLEARLDRAIYAHGDSISVHVYIANDSHRSVRRIEVLALQHVEVCMFNNGIFKNTVASELEQDNCPLASGSTLTKTYSLRPTEGSPKHWIALEETYTRTGTSLACTVRSSEVNEKDRSPYYAINVSYYVQVKLLTSLMCEKISVKLPFTLIHRGAESEIMTFSTSPREIPGQTPTQGKNDARTHRKVGEINEKKRDPIPDVELIKNIDPKES